jgi:hypothetical protein
LHTAGAFFIFVLMINRIRNFVLYIINKQNNGFITPDEFNSFAHQVQLDLQREIIEDRTIAINRSNSGTQGNGYSDIATLKDEIIDIFTVINSPLVNISANEFAYPVDMYRMTTMTYGGRIMDRISLPKLAGLLLSDKTAPNAIFPAYAQKGSNILAYPDTITTGVSATYLRYPNSPKWTYTVLPGTDAPLFNQAAPDYQDFELPVSCEMEISIRILQMCGISIRDNDIVQAAKQEELQSKQER